MGPLVWYIHTLSYLHRSLVPDEYTCGQLHVDVKGSPVVLQTPVYLDMICRSMTAPLLVLSPSSVFPLPLFSYILMLPKKIMLSFRKFHLNLLYFF